MITWSWPLSEDWILIVMRRLLWQSSLKALDQFKIKQCLATHIRRQWRGQKALVWDHRRWTLLQRGQRVPHQQNLGFKGQESSEEIEVPAIVADNLLLLYKNNLAIINKWTSLCFVEKVAKHPTRKCWPLPIRNINSL